MEAGERGKIGGVEERGASGVVGGGEECEEWDGVVRRGCKRGATTGRWVGSAEGGGAGEVAGGSEWD